jgi:putative FmdB family regulatory protein
MPLYHYRCENCETQVELFRSLSDKEDVRCDGCGTRLKKMPSAVAIAVSRSPASRPMATTGTCGGGGGG